MSRGLGDNIGSDQWCEAKKKAEAAKDYAKQQQKFNKMSLQLKLEKQGSAGSSDRDGISVNGKVSAMGNKFHNDAQSSKYSFVSNFNQLKSKAQTLKDR